MRLQIAPPMIGVIRFIPLKRARRILSLADDKCRDLIALPLDSHCLFIGDKTIVALRGEFGPKPLAIRGASIDDNAFRRVPRRRVR